ncbi:hypothetical protein WJ966_04865 [Achromobacter xylosoxidans]
MVPSRSTEPASSASLAPSAPALAGWTGAPSGRRSVSAPPAASVSEEAASPVSSGVTMFRSPPR